MSTVKTLKSWQLSSGTEPLIRVGVVLPADHMDRIRLQIPEQAYALSAEVQGGQTLSSITADVSVTASQVCLKSESGLTASDHVIRLTPIEHLPVRRAGGIRLRGVPTGRGFHWEKRIHPSLEGAIEFRACGGHLLVVNELPLEDYLPGVVAGEMSGECPVEFLKSQCVVARSWVLAHTEKKHTELPVDRCNDDCCQRYHGTTDLTDTVLGAVRDTRGLVLLDTEGRLIDANYSKSCGGVSESPENVWSVSKSGQRAAVDAPPGSEAFRFFPVSQERLDEYLTGAWLENTDVFCSPNVVPEKELPRYLNKVDEGGGHFRWRVSCRRAELEDILRLKFFRHQDPIAVAPLETLLDLRVLRRGLSGRARELEVVYLDPMGGRRQATVSSEYAIRDALHEQFLYSSAFSVQREDGSDGLAERFIFRGAGWGHGAGLCQIGALGMALRGYDCTAILTHYFERVSLQSCY